jgi:hypothetical protein
LKDIFNGGIIMEQKPLRLKAFEMQFAQRARRLAAAEKLEKHIKEHLKDLENALEKGEDLSKFHLCHFTLIKEWK